MGVAGQRGDPPLGRNSFPRYGLRRSQPTRIHSLTPHSYGAQQIHTDSSRLLV